MILTNYVNKKEGEKVMKKLAGCMALVVAVLMMGSVAFAWDFTDHVKQAPNGKGDALIFPFYVALPGGWETKLTVINTATDRSVVAKVVVRTQTYSLEVLDWLIYLTPTDVWTGIVRYNTASGKVEIYSTDDSMLFSSGANSPTTNPTLVWASQTAVAQSLSTPPCGDRNTIGYVEVFESAHTVAGAVYPETGTSLVDQNLNAPPVSKQALWRAYWDSANNVFTTLTAPMVADNINVLAGYMEFRNLTINQKATVQATILKDYGATLGAGGGSAFLNTNRLTTFSDPANAYNSQGEVEAALSKTDLSMYYSDKNLTFHMITFPTKLSPINLTTCTFLQADIPSPFFRGNTLTSTGSGTATSPRNYCLGYQSSDYSLTELGSPCAGDSLFSPQGPGCSFCEEVNIRTGGFAYSEGWTRYAFPQLTLFDVKNGNAPYNTAASDGNFTGAPVIGTILHLGTTNDAFAAAPAAWTDGRVQDRVAAPVAPNTGFTTYYYYQYQDERNTGYLYDANLPSGNTTAPVIINPWGNGVNIGGESQERTTTSTTAGDGHHPINPRNN